MFHCNLVHASGSNMTPWNRTIVYISANTVGNAIRWLNPAPAASPFHNPNGEIDMVALRAAPGKILVYQ